MPRLPHYTGLTGVRTPDEATRALEIFHGHGFKPGEPHTNMIGVLASPATIENGTPLHCKKPWRQVADFRALVETLLAVKGKGLPMVHLELHKQWPGTPGDAEHAIRLLNALKREGAEPAVQLNGILTPDDFKRIHGETDAALVLQLRQELTRMSPDTVLQYVQAVQHDIAGILTDASAGTGKAFDPARSAFWQKWLSLEKPDADLMFGHAGGLNGSNAASQTRALREDLGHTHFSLDTESGARWQTGDPAEPDALDLEPGGAFEQYVHGTKEGLGD